MSFSKGVGRWIGAAEVYDGAGDFAGHGHDERTVVADDDAGTVTVDVSFAGPFSIAGRYTIVDHGDHRQYLGPVNVGYAEAFGDGLVVAHNYWADLGLSQRFFLMVLPDGSRQLSLALITRGESLRWVVVGEYQRQTDPHRPAPPEHASIDAEAVAGDPNAGRAGSIIGRPGRWSGEVSLFDGSLQPAGSCGYVEQVTSRRVSVAQPGFDPAAGFGHAVEHDDRSYWTPSGPVVGSAGVWGGRAVSGQFLLVAEGLRVWRREVASLDGTTKSIVHHWYRGEERIGVVCGAVGYEA